MATRQYIGARYVVKIYENSVTAGSAEWEANTSYEPLTMVTYQNGSYLSKKAVPANVGNPAVNTGYWVVTGAYNGQIAALQAAVTAINTKIGDLANLPTTDKDSIVDAIIEISSDITALTSNIKTITPNDRFWYIGDSFLEAANGWGAKLDSIIGRSNSYYTYDGGAGFAKPGNVSGRNLGDMVAALTDVPSDITKVIIIAGINDCRDTYQSALASAIQTLFANVKAKAPNAQIFVGYNATYPLSIVSDYSERCNNITPVYRKIVNNAAIYGVTVMRGVYFGIQDKTFISSDGVHPTEAGYIFIARIVNAKLNNADITIPQHFNGTALTFKTCEFDNLYAQGNLRGELYNGASITCPAKVYTEIASSYNLPIAPRSNSQFVFNCNLEVEHSDNTTEFVVGCSVLYSTNGKMYVLLPVTKTDVVKIYWASVINQVIPIMPFL